MWNADVTWGDLRKFHSMLQANNKTSPDDFLSDQEFALKSQGQEDDALVFPGESGVTYSFTIDEDNDRVLELLKADEESGKMFFRANGAWVEIKDGNESPTIFEVPMHDINEQSVQWATDFWDNLDDEDEDITLEDVKSHLA